MTFTRWSNRRRGRASVVSAVTLLVGLLVGTVVSTVVGTVAAPSARASMVRSGYYLLAYSGEIVLVDAAARTVTWVSPEAWAAAGWPVPAPAPTRYVHYPWSPSISAVTSFDPADSSTWRWAHLDLAAWARARYPTPQAAAYIDGSTLHRWATSPELFVTDPGGVTHRLTPGQWQAMGFRPFTTMSNQGFMKLSWDEHIARMTDLIAGQGYPISPSQWSAEGWPTPQVVARAPGDVVYHAPGDPTLWYAGPTVNRPITSAEWRTMGFPSPVISTPAAPFSSRQWQSCTTTLAGVGVTVGAGQRTVTVADAHDGTYATLSMFARTDSACGFTTLFSDAGARIGYGGITDGATRAQGSGTTPTGTYTMTEAFGLAANPGTALLYRPAGVGDFWVEDNRSTYYNTFRNADQGGFDPSATGIDSSERLTDYPGQYAYAVVVDFNRPPDRTVPYRGAGIFVHVRGAGATAGCVSTSAANVVTMLGYLRSGDTITITF